MKIKKVILESIIRQELKKVLKEANNPFQSLYETLLEDLDSALNIFAIVRELRQKNLIINEDATRFAAKMKVTILREVAKGIKKAQIRPSEIVIEAGEYTAENVYPKRMSGEEKVYDAVLGKLTETTEKYYNLEKNLVGHDEY